MFIFNHSLKDKISSIIKIYLIGIVSSIILICNISIAFRISKEYDDLSLVIARTLSNEVDGDKIEKWINTRTTDYDYEDLKIKLGKLINVSNKIEYIFIQICDDDAVRYVADIDQNHVYSPFMHSEPYINASAKYIDEVRSGREFTYLSISEKFGIKITSNTPIYNSYGKYIASACASVDISHIVKDCMVYNISFLIIFIIIILIATGILRNKLDKYIFIPLQNLTSYAENYRFRNDIKISSIREKCVILNTGDEFEKLFKAFIKMEFKMAKNIRLIKEKQWENDHDFMTCLYNKRMLNRNFSIFNSHKSIGVIFLDVNNLKEVNDKLGHDEGDRLICSVAKILEGYNKSESIYCFRMGGDEFMMLLINCKKEEVLKLLDILKWRFQNSILDFGIKCSVSTGYTYGEYPYDLDQLIKSADENMYINKMELKNE